MHNPEDPYHVQFSLIGDRIIFSDPSGFAASKSTKKSLQLNQIVENEVLKKERTYVQIENFSKLSGFTINARLTYIRHFQKRESVCGLVFMGVPYLTALSIKIAARIYLAGFPIRVAYSYEEAITYSLELLHERGENNIRSQKITQEDDLSVSPSGEDRVPDPKSIDDYKMEVLKYLGTLNLDVETPGFEPVEFSDDHPFASVFETIDLINHDLNQLIIERQKDEKKKMELERKLADSQKMEALGTLAGGIAHDFNNILSGIIGYCQLAKLNIHDSQKTIERIDQIKQGAFRAADLVNQILIFSRNTEYKKQPQQLAGVVTEAMMLLRSSIPSTIRIEEYINSRKIVMADAAKIHQIVMNLCTNSYQAMDESGGVLSVSLNDVDIIEPQGMGLPIKPGTYVRLVVTDTGHGMDSETLLRIFDPYFTTKEIGKGTGMGLSLVYAIVQEHSGYIKARSAVQQGSEFTVYLPVTSAGLPSYEKSEQPMSIPAGNEHIMVVDDEKTILESTRELLLDYGYQVSCYADGSEALNAFYDHPYLFNLVLTDMTMPGITGDILAEKILEIRGDMPIIICTGFNEKMSEKKALAMGIKRFIQKPVVGQPIAEIIRTVLDETLNDPCL